VSNDEQQVSSIIALLIIPTILCVSIGIMIGITIAEEKVLEDEAI
jgi:ABC-type proline/glycine betaine transport system permease subunit